MIKRLDLPDILVTLLFLVIITANLWVPLLQIEDAPKINYRRLVSKLEIGWNREIFSVPDKFTQYISDNFPLQNQMIQLAHWVRHYVFQEDIISQVIIGKDGWLYFNTPQNLDLCQNAKDWGNPTRYIDQINKTNEFLAKRGITYAIMIIPGKCRIYPENIQHLLPDLAGKNSTMPLVDHISKKSDALMINLYDALISEKDNHLVYFKTDTHWSSIGAYLGYQEIAKSLFPGISSQELITLDYEKDFTSFNRDGNLARMLKLPEFLAEATYQPDIRSSLLQKTSDSGENIYENPEADNDLTLIVFHDSFFRIPPIKELLASHFHRTVYVSIHDGFLWTNDQEEIKDLIDKWDPDIILLAPFEGNLEFFLLD